MPKRPQGQKHPADLIVCGVLGKSSFLFSLLITSAAVTGPATAVTLSPIKGGTMDGIPLAQALGTLQDLGNWGGVWLFQVMSCAGGECGISGIDDADTCPRFTLFAVDFGETSVPVDFTVFRLPETIGWKVPKGTKLKSGGSVVNIPLPACEMKKTNGGYGWKGTSYVLHVTGDLKDGPDGYGHYVFAADLEKLTGERADRSR